MNIWLVSPAWRRFAVTELVLAQRRWLCDTLAARGWTANSVIVADDENLDIAHQYGFPTVERDNDDLGARFNAGYQYAAEQGCDIFVHIGSDDWVHPDAFNVLDELDLEKTPLPDDLGPGETMVWSPAPTVVAQRRLLLIDATRGRAQRCWSTGAYGCIPWLIPRSLMAAARFRPIAPGLMRGIDGALFRGLRTNFNWAFQDAPDEWCVDFKTDTNVTPYRGIAHALGVGEEDSPWLMLSDFYPEHLVKMAARVVSK